MPHHWHGPHSGWHAASLKYPVGDSVTLLLLIVVSVPVLAARVLSGHYRLNSRAPRACSRSRSSESESLAVADSDGPARLAPRPASLPVGSASRSEPLLSCQAHWQARHCQWHALAVGRGSRLRFSGFRVRLGVPSGCPGQCGWAPGRPSLPPCVRVAAFAGQARLSLLLTPTRAESEAP